MRKTDLFKDQYLEIQDEEGKMILGRIHALESRTNTFLFESKLQKKAVPLSHFLDKLIFVYYTGSDQTKYQFTTNVIDFIEESSMYRLSIPEDSAIMKVQNREYVRVNTELECHLFSLIEPSNTKIILTKDISGGGLSYISKVPLELEEKEWSGMIYLFKGNDQVSIPFQAEVVYCEELDLNQYKVALKFSQIKEQHRSSIIKYAMKVEVKQAAGRAKV